MAKHRQMDREGNYSEWFRSTTQPRLGFVRGNSFELKPVRYSAIEGKAIFEGDIVIGDLDQIESLSDQMDEVTIPVSGLYRGIGVVGAQYRWPGGRVPYEIDPALPDQARVTDAIQHWEERTQIRFVARTSANASQHSNYVRFTDKGGCFSRVGMQGGLQEISLGAGCGFGAAVHEIGHAVGLWHEQSREDRDQHIRIQWENITAGMEHNFNQHITDGDDIGSYDFGSIMHYGSTAFSKNGQPTIAPLNGEAIGQRDGMSDLDVAAVEFMYPNLGGGSSGTISVKGPDQWSRTGGPPTFQVNAGGRYYIFEITSRPELLDITLHGSERTDSNFYGSWSDSPHFTAPQYQLSQAAWDRLKGATELYYRIGTTTSATGYDNYQVSTPDAQVQMAPRLTVTGAGTVEPTTGAPSVSGPTEWARTSGPPSFEVNAGPGRYYIFEITSRPELLDITAHGNERTDTTFYGSWSDSSHYSSPQYQLPQAAWDRLKDAEELYYRIGTTTSATGYDDYQVSTSDSDAASAPYIAVVGAGGTVQPSTGAPSVTGPTSSSRSAGPPSFEVNAGAGRYYIFEITSRPDLLDITAHGNERTDGNFYGSWSDSPHFTEPQYQLSEAAWDRLKGATELYYRVGTTTSADGYDNYEVSTSDSDASQAPSIHISAADAERRAPMGAGAGSRGPQQQPSGYRAANAPPGKAR